MGLKNNLEELVKLIENTKNLDEKIEVINTIRESIHAVSPFKGEPVDFVKWVKNENIVANDYNPNKVAPPEMELLEVSIMNDGYTQPIVSWEKESNILEVVDGFHRNRVGKESNIIRERVKGYLPIVNIRKEQSDKNDRIASTIRHNRARGKHQVNAMSEIVIELKNRNWSNSRISKQLGMDEEEVLRLCQISGIENLFSDTDFSRAWENSDFSEEYETLSYDLTQDNLDMYRIPNEQDTERIYHTYDKWECYRAGFYENTKEGWTHEQCEQEFERILKNKELFEDILKKVIEEWKHSCEHYLTNKSMNRLAWLGQAAVCYSSGVPSRYSGAWFNLTEEEQNITNNVALKYLNIWLKKNNRKEVTIDEAISKGRQIELY